VIGGQAGLMQSVFQLRRMIICCEQLYDWFLQIPFGAFYRILMMKDLILSPDPLSLCHRLTDEEVSEKILRSVLIKAAGPANRKK
jgi:hypothetical protein